jgi:hypothetical protein
MPRSMPRRVELLERNARARPDRMPTEDLLVELERAAGLPPAQTTNRFRAAWEAYRQERDRLLVTDEAPLATYRPDLPPAPRRRRFLTWDHPRIAKAVDELLRAYIELTGARDRPPR